MNRRSSSILLLLTIAATGIEFWSSMPDSHLASAQSGASGRDGANRPRKRLPRPIPTRKRTCTLASAPESAELSQVCRSRQTEFLNYGAIRLIDVGDDVPNLADFLAAQASGAAEKHELCLLAAFLPSCSSCAAIGYSLAEGAMARALGPLTLIRIDVDEFEQELQQLGLFATDVPVFALLSDAGNMIDQLDSSDWSSNNPADFLPILSDFIQRKPVHHRGGRHSIEKRVLLKL